jgi:hypothetical protein
MPAFVLILLFQSTGGYGMQTAAISQYGYQTIESCSVAAKEASKLNSNIRAICVKD